MRFLQLCFISLDVLILTNALALAQTPTFFTFTAGTGSSATVGVPTAANPNVDSTSLSTGDEIGVFTPAGLCVGAVEWTVNQNAAITVWGDNEQTTEVVDGIKAGEEMNYKIWRKATNTTHAQKSVTYAHGDGRYANNGIYILSALSAVKTSVRNDDGAAAVTKVFDLRQNYPNPFNPSTTIHYSLSQPGLITLKIFNVSGQEIATLVDGRQNAGEHQIHWQAQGISSGVYFYQLRADDHVGTRKMILMP